MLWPCGLSEQAVDLRGVLAQAAGFSVGVWRGVAASCVFFSFFVVFRPKTSALARSRLLSLCCFSGFATLVLFLFSICVVVGRLFGRQRATEAQALLCSDSLRVGTCVCVCVCFCFFSPPLFVLLVRDPDSSSAAYPWAVVSA